MKYSVDIVINKPREEVVRLIDNQDNLQHWQPGFQSMEYIEGEPRAVGSKSRLKYKMGKRDIEMIETVLDHSLPDKFKMSFDTPGALNIQENHFEAISENQTRWVSYNEFKFSKLPYKIMGFLMPGAFKKQTRKFMELFKAFAEKT